MKALKAFFLSRLMREKALLLAFAGLGAAIWLSSFARRASVFSREFRATTMDLKMQRRCLDSRQAIEDAAKKAIAQLDPAKTLSTSSLIAAANGMATAAGLKNITATASPDQRTSQFSKHSISVQIRPADFEGLEKFYLELRKRSPYIGVEQCTIQVTGPTLAAVFTLSSVEVLPQK